MPNLLNIPPEIRQSILRYTLELDEINACKDHTWTEGSLMFPASDLGRSERLPIYLVCHQITVELNAIRPDKIYLRFCFSDCARRCVSANWDYVKRYVQQISFPGRQIDSNDEEETPSYDRLVSKWKKELLSPLVWTILKIDNVSGKDYSRMVTLKP